MTDNVTCSVGFDISVAAYNTVRKIFAVTAKKVVVSCTITYRRLKCVSTSVTTSVHLCLPYLLYTLSPVTIILYFLNVIPHFPEPYLYL